MNKNKYLLLWSSLGALGLLGTAAVQENFLKEWRVVQQGARSEAGPIPVHLRQIVVADLGEADRCVTCHVGMAPGEQGLSGPDVVRAHSTIPHDPADFGCTVCHAGQGLATEQADAHGAVHFWPEPMIPLRYAQAGCGSCHTPTSVPERGRLAQGQGLVERYDCLACHRIDERGGTLRPDGSGMEGPDLSAVGVTGWDQDWYEKHLQQVRLKPGHPWSDSFRPIDASDLEVIEVFLGTRIAAPQWIASKSLFHTRGCLGCHKVGGVGGSEGPDLTQAGLKDPGRLDFTHVPGEPTLANWLAEHLRSPATVVPGSMMPAMDFTPEEIDQLTLFTLSLRRGDYPGTYWPKDRVRGEKLGVREFAADGATLYAAFCSACHGSEGGGMRYSNAMPVPSVANPDFLAIASDAFITETIRSGRPGRGMPAWGDPTGGLRPQEMAAIVAHLRSVGDTPAPSAETRPARWARGDVPSGARLFAAHCQGCHGSQGQGAVGPALNHPMLLGSATDTYLFESIGRGRSGTPMHGFARPSTLHPVLSPAEIESLVSYMRTLERP